MTADRMTATAHPQAPTTAGPGLHLVVVRTPQPPPEELRPLRLVVPGMPVPRRVHRPGPRPRVTTQLDPDAAEFGPTLSSRGDLPDPGTAGRRLITLALETLAGRRPLAQLQALTAPRVFAALAGGRRPQWCAEGTSPLFVGRVHVCEPVDGIAEVSAVARRAGRAHAVAARLEGIDGRWRCTALQIG
jgi:hypothetical protein